MIASLIKNKQIDTKKREIINNILYTSFEKYAVKKATEFKKFHYFKCKNIDKNDLILNSKFGLVTAIKKYNGNSSFSKFIEFYINIELYKVITNHFSLSALPKSIRIKNKKNLTEEEKIKYRELLYIDFVSYSDYWRFDKKIENNDMLDIINENEELINFWKNVNQLKDPFLIRILYLKYDVELNKIRSNKEISTYMCCSEEYIRLSLSKSFNLIRNMY
jgi:hypothetical protein